MLGLFDSGRGGLNTVRYLKKYKADGDLIYLIDGNNAPYGIRTEKEITEIATENVRLLTDMGARRVLIACCTASTVHPNLPKRYQEVSVPIITPIARATKRATRTGRIGVIATEHTVSSEAFRKALDGCSVKQLSLSELVPLIDAGLSDDTVTDADITRLEAMLEPILKEDIDTLILGCTHFPALKNTIDKIAEKYGDIRLIDSAKVGADLLRKYTG
jgi:glutamate racemase